MTRRHDETGAGLEPAPVDVEHAAVFADHAHRYAELGWALIRVDGKRPRDHGWEQTRPAEPGYMAGQWAQHGKHWNLGVVLGSSGLAVYEYDSDDARDEFYALLDHKPPKTPIAVTGSGKRHVYFAARNGLTKAARDGLELRVGNHQCLVPPSVHPDTGEPYRWLEGHAPWEVGLAELPDTLIDYFAADAVKRQNGPAAPVGDKIPYGRQHYELVSLAGTMPRRGLNADEIYAALKVVNEQRCERPGPDENIRRIADSVAGYEPDPDTAIRTEPVERLATTVGEPTLQDVLAAVRRYLELDAGEAMTFAVVLAVAVARELTDEEPLWLMLVTASGGTKTEAIRLLKLSTDGRVDELTRAGLLSWSTVGQKTRRTGLLTVIPEVAFVTISDFSTVVTMGNHEARARMFGALRVVYDGRLYRSIGGQPAGDGEQLEWEGHLTLLAGATPVVDTHFSFEAAMGERWLLYRPDEVEIGRGRRHARYAIDRKDVPPLRERAQQLAGALVHRARQRIPAELADESKDMLVDTATLIAQVRTGVEFEGQGRYRTVVGYPMPELPMRLAQQLHRFARCLVAIGVDEQLAVRLAVKTACDSVPVARWKAFRHVADTEAATVSSTWRAIGRGNRWGAKWQLNALEAIGLVDVEGPDEDEDPQASRIYRLAGRYRELYESVAPLLTFPLYIGAHGG